MSNEQLKLILLGIINNFEKAVQVSDDNLLESAVERHKVIECLSFYHPHEIKGSACALDAIREVIDELKEQAKGLSRE